MTVGEVGIGNEDDFRVYTSAKKGELNMMFNFKHTSVGENPKCKYELIPFTLKDFKLALAESFLFIENTDCWSTTSIWRIMINLVAFRVLAQILLNGVKISSKMLATLIISLTGTVFIYQGQEL
ncbi:alpha-glucosidase maltase, partial [Fusarium falciforme]